MTLSGFALELGSANSRKSKSTRMLDLVFCSMELPDSIASRMMRSLLIQSLSDTAESFAPLGPKVAESFFYALEIEVAATKKVEPQRMTRPIQVNDRKGAKVVAERLIQVKLQKPT